MSTKTLFLAIFLLGSLETFAQTKLIFHKSHSGSLESFENALKEDFFDLKLANFGRGPRREVKNAQLDSLIFISDSVVVMVTSVYCQDLNRSRGKDKKYLGEFWEAGKDTIYHHQLFGKQHHLNHIKEVLREQYNFQNNIEKVAFIGYDNKQKRKKRKKKKITDSIPEAQVEFSTDEKQPLLPPQNPGNFPQFLLYTLLGIVILLALTAGLLLRQAQQLKVSD